MNIANSKSVVAAAALVGAAGSALAQDSAERTYAEIEATFGFVPSFFREYPEHGIAGAWALTRDLELSADTALSPKVKSLINIAVGAQIPCRYCVCVDTLTAREHGCACVF